MRSRRAWSSWAGPTTRSRSAVGGSSSARSTPRCSGWTASAGRRRRCGRHRPAPRSWSATSTLRPGVELDRPARADGAAPHPAGPAGPAARRRRRHPDPHVRQGRPRRPAVAARVGAAGRRRAVEPALDGTARWLAGLWARVLGHAGRPNRQADFFTDGGGSLSAAQLVAAHPRAVPAGHGRRRLRVPPAGPARRPARGAGPGRRRRPSRARTVQPLPRRAQLVQQLVAFAFTLGRPARAGWSGSAGRRACCGPATARPGLPRAAPGGGSRVGWLLLISPVGRIGLSVACRPAAAARGQAGQVPARRVGAPAALGGRARGRHRSVRRTCPARRGSLTTHGFGREGRARTSTCTRCRRSPG